MKFYSDSQFYHLGAMLSFQRPYITIEEMNRELVNNYNNVVDDKDEIIIVGDLIGGKNYNKSIIKELKGKKHLIVGNHEKQWLTKEDYNLFESVQENMFIKVGELEIYLYHYPISDFDDDINKILIFGHDHNRINDSYYKMKNKLNCFNSTVDINFFKPINLSEMIINNAKFYKRDLGLYKNSFWNKVYLVDQLLGVKNETKKNI